MEPAVALRAMARQPSLTSLRGTSGGLPSRSSRSEYNRWSPPSPCGLWRGSLRSLRYEGLPGACLAVAREASTTDGARRRPSGYGEAAFAHFATRDFRALPSRSSRSEYNRLSPPSPFGLWRGSLRSLRYEG